MQTADFNYQRTAATSIARYFPHSSYEGFWRRQLL